MKSPTSIEDLRNLLRQCIALKLPIKIKSAAGESMVYARGFADAQLNILLVSSEKEAMALNIVELKSIRMVEWYGKEDNSTELLPGKFQLSPL